MRYDFGMVIVAAMAAVSLILFDARSGSAAWVAPALGLSMLVFASRRALRRRKMVSRIRCFHNRFRNWQLENYLIHFDGLNSSN